MWNCFNLDQQITALVKKYPKLNIIESGPNEIRLNGSIDIFRSALDFVLQKTYQIDIVIPEDDSILPTVIDIGNAIAADFPHRYSSGALCLETDTFVRNRFIDGFDFLSWMDEFVEPYFFSYEFFNRFGYFPFGERPHGLEGLIHTYQEFFKESDLNTALKLMVYAADKPYRGHDSCPCENGKKLRQCHGPALFPFMTDIRKKDILISDVNYMRKELEKYEQSMRNRRKAK